MLQEARLEHENKRGHQQDTAEETHADSDACQDAEPYQGRHAAGGEDAETQQDSREVEEQRAA